eukprot:TRINITY_DN4078_c0_g1_i1.p1 TRINITY_DN4078_c0_g1~~TRINITY_DN4078_c0_g1_i1.p1  ORF type:complete len:739 (-),score=96.14 TRINITY_DN4078_c0_g1_i1:436-2652(-)
MLGENILVGMTEQLWDFNCSQEEGGSVQKGSSTPLKRLYFLDSPEEQETRKRPRLVDSFKAKLHRNKYVFDDEEEELFQQSDDEEEEIVALTKCEEISLQLREALGKLHICQDRFNLTDGAVLPSLVTKQHLNQQGQNLKEYQLVGINFMRLLYEQGIGGAILADEMGLGKTAQAITFLSSIITCGDYGPHLIVCPPSLLENWQRELALWGPELKVVTYYGSKRERVRYAVYAYRQRVKRCGSGLERVFLKQAEEDSESQSSEEEEEGQDDGILVGVNGEQIIFDEFDSKPPFNVLLTCYTLFEKNSSEASYDRRFLYGWDYSVVLLDEAHAVKNKATSRSQRLVKLIRLSRMRLLLTGTPLQNDLIELSNLLEYLEPELFNEETKEKLSGAMQDPERREGLFQQMRRVLAPFVLRRLKSEVAIQLSAKLQNIVRLDMPRWQQRLYQEAVQRVRCEIQHKFVDQLGAQRVKNIFTQLRKLSQHPLLIRSDDWFDSNAVEEIGRTAHARQFFGPYCGFERVQQELEVYSDFALHELAKQLGGRFADNYCLGEEALYSSAKFCHLRTMLPNLKKQGHRPLIFSQWTSVLDLLEWLLSSLNMSYLRLDGSTPVQERLSRVDCFNEPDSEIFAFLLSTRAGGQGLNLTGADTVIIHDVDFNPQVDRQAEDRCHRLGQIKTVSVYRLIVRDSVDEQIYACAERKLQLDEAVLGEQYQSTNSGDRGNERRLMNDILTDLITKQQ